MFFFVLEYDETKYPLFENYFYKVIVISKISKNNQACKNFFIVNLCVILLLKNYLYVLLETMSIFKFYEIKGILIIFMF